MAKTTKAAKSVASQYMKQAGTGGALSKLQRAGLVNQSKFAMPRMFKNGGTVKKTGMALVHKGEKVLTAAQKKKMAKGLSRNYS